MTLDELKSRLDVIVSDQLLRQALTHITFSIENRNQPNNERLEFLGDSVLGLVVVAQLYERFPDFSEGQLSKLKHEVVSAKALAAIGRDLKLGEHLIMGRGEEQTGGRDKDNLIADAVEAIFGAVYLEAGFESARALIAKLVFPLLENPEDLLANSDPKQQLFDLARSQNLGTPEYENNHEGADNNRTFFSTVRVGQVVGTGSGRSRKTAEAAAASDAAAKLRGN